MSRVHKMCLQWIGVAVTATLCVATGAAGAPTPTVIKDPVNPSSARVDSGRLRVGDGSGPLTVDGSVSVTNVVGTAAQSPATAFTAVAGMSGTIYSSILHTAGADARLAISSITVTSSSPDAESIWIGTGPCDTTQVNLLLLRFRLASGETVHLPFPQPVELTNPLAPGTPWCLKADVYNQPLTLTEAAHFIVVGYEH